MPVAVNFSSEDQPALHEDVTDWEYYNIGGETIICLFGNDGDDTVAELVASNVNQITPLSEEEFEEAVDLIQ